MNKDLLQQLFGSEPAKIYVYVGELVDGDSQVENITHKFATAAGTNLISCVVTNLQGTNLVYTKEDYNINDENFIFFVDLPLPPEPVREIVPDEPAPVPVEEGQTPSEGTQ